MIIADNSNNVPIQNLQHFQGPSGTSCTTVCHSRVIRPKSYIVFRATVLKTLGRVRGGEINCPCCPSRTFVAPDK